MNKVFKASILAASVALSFGASAATVTPSSVTYLSAEGVAQGVKSDKTLVTFDVIVEKNHPASSVITLTFDKNLDLGDLAAANGGVVTQLTSDGQAYSGDVAFDYGTGSFTFDNVEIDAEKGTISFVVNLGNPLTADSAFRVYLGDATGKVAAPANTGSNEVILSGKSYVSYNSAKVDGSVIETGTGLIADVKSQFAFAIETPFNNLIDRKNYKLFTDTTKTDVLNFTLSNDETLAAALKTVSAVVDFAGAFGDTLDGDYAVDVGTVAANGVGAPTPSKSTKVSVTLAAAAVEDAADTDVALTFDLATVGADIPQTGTIKAKVTLSSANGTGPFVYKMDQNAGEWRLDAAIVNVPYLPVGYTFTPNVEISNIGTTDAEIQVKAFDQYGVEYKTVTLPFKAKAHTVTKVSEADLEKAFGLDPLAKKKLSTTFIIDADLNNITLVPYYKEGVSRINVLADQYKSDDAR